jgi:hypothetical protein
MIETSTPINGACPDGERCRLINDLVTEEERQFSNAVKNELMAIRMEPRNSVIRRLLDFSLSLQR